MTGSVPEWLQALWRLDPELAKIAKHDRDAIIEARYVAVSEVSKMGRKLGMIQVQRDELLAAAKNLVYLLEEELSLGKTVCDFELTALPNMRSAIANAEARQCD